MILKLQRALNIEFIVFTFKNLGTRFAFEFFFFTSLILSKFHRYREEKELFKQLTVCWVYCHGINPRGKIMTLNCVECLILIVFILGDRFNISSPKSFEA